jgi:hypothetical protein
LPEDHPRVRYFWFAVLHEAAHAICQHHAPNEISEAKDTEQEAEANRLALQWFNGYAARKNLPRFSEDELAHAQQENQERAVRIFEQM